MKLCLTIFVLLASTYTFASECLNISGSYDTNFYGGSPKCARGVKVEKSWFKYEQMDCKTLTYSKVYKLADGTLCESAKVTFITDGQERTYGNSDLMSKIELFTDKQISTSRSISSGNILTSIKTFDSIGNLVVEDNTGFHEVYERSLIK